MLQTTTFRDITYHHSCQGVSHKGQATRIPDDTAYSSSITSIPSISGSITTLSSSAELTTPTSRSTTISLCLAPCPSPFFHGLLTAAAFTRQLSFLPSRVPSLSIELPLFFVRSTRNIRALSGVGSSTADTDSSLYLTNRETKSHFTRSTPRDSWMCPKTWRGGRTVQSTCRRYSQPWLAAAPSRWNLGGPWVTSIYSRTSSFLLDDEETVASDHTSVSSGISIHILCRRPCGSSYPKPHSPHFGLQGDPNTVKLRPSFNVIFFDSWLR